MTTKNSLPASAEAKSIKWEILAHLPLGSETLWEIVHKIPSKGSVSLIFSGVTSWKCIQSDFNSSHFAKFLAQRTNDEIQIFGVGPETQKKIVLDGPVWFPSHSRCFQFARCSELESGLLAVLNSLSSEQVVMVFGAKSGKGTAAVAQAKLKTFQSHFVFELYDLVSTEAPISALETLLQQGIPNGQFLTTEIVVFQIKAAATAKKFVELWPETRATLKRLSIQSAQIHALTPSALAIFEDQLGKTSPIHVTL